MIEDEIVVRKMRVAGVRVNVVQADTSFVKELLDLVQMQHERLTDKRMLQESEQKYMDLYREVQEISITDGLTGVYNRRHFYNTLEAEAERAKRYGSLFSIIIFDLDGFKKYNDCFGHGTGDEILKSFAGSLRSSLRRTDLVFRQGGDEFAALMPYTNCDFARMVTERFREGWPSDKFEKLDGVRLGFSAGIAEFPKDSETIDGLVFLADTALYHSKSQGKYRSTCISEMSSLMELDSSTMGKVYGLAGLVDGKDLNKEGHSQRVAKMSEAIGKHMGIEQKELASLYAASLLHDVGMLSIPESIVSKRDKLTDNEWEQIKRHSLEGAKIVGHFKELSGAAELIRYHHERYDGSGYPHGVCGEAIPLGARIIAVADAYDSMTAASSYRPAKTQEQALDEMRKCCGSQFDPLVVEHFLRIFP